MIGHLLTTEEKIVNELSEFWQGQYFGTWHFAWHAAFPVVLTPDLLHKIRLNFYADENGNPFHIPLTAVPDILHAPFVKEIGSGMWEMMPGVRTLLLKNIRDDHNLGLPRLERLARFLWVYLQENPNKMPSKAFAEAQKWYSKCYINPKFAAIHLIKNITGQNKTEQRKNRRKNDKLLALADEVMALAKVSDVLQSAVSISLLSIKGNNPTYNEQEIADILEKAPALKDYLHKNHQPSSKAIRFPIPSTVWKEIADSKKDKQKNKGFDYLGKLHLYCSDGVNPAFFRKLLDYHSDTPADDADTIRIGSFNTSAPDKPIRFNVFELDQQLPPEFDHLLISPGGLHYVVIQLDPGETIFREKHRQQLQDWTLRIFQVIGHIHIGVLIITDSDADISQITIGADYWCPIEEVIPLSFSQPQAWLNEERLQDSVEKSQLLRIPPDEMSAWSKLSNPIYYQKTDVQNFKEQQGLAFGALFNFLRSLHLSGEIINTWAQDAVQKLDQYHADDILVTRPQALTYFSIGLFFSRTLNEGIIYLSDLPKLLKNMEMLRAFERYNLLFQREQKGQSVVVIPSRLTNEKLSFSSSVAMPARIKKEHRVSQYSTYFFKNAISPILFPKIATEIGKQTRSIPSLSLSRHQIQFAFDTANVEIFENPSSQALSYSVSCQSGNIHQEKIDELITEQASWFHNFQNKSELRFQLVHVEGGNFMMGKNRYDEKPIHEVQLGNFMIGKYPVTISEIQVFAQHQNLKPLQQNLEGVLRNYKAQTGKTDFLRYPVVLITWGEAVLYCNWLSQIWGLEAVYRVNGSGSSFSAVANWDAKGFRLPTEAEWEFAAKGGQQSKNFLYAGSNDLSQVAVYGQELASEVGTRLPNELGIFDMSGNVKEWCWDNYGPYQSRLEINPRGERAGTGEGKIVRGGDYGRGGIDTYQVTKRGKFSPDQNAYDIGFRLARNI